MWSADASSFVVVCALPSILIERSAYCIDTNYGSPVLTDSVDLCYIIRSASVAAAAGSTAPTPPATAGSTSIIATSTVGAAYTLRDRRVADLYTPPQPSAQHQYQLVHAYDEESIR